MLGMARTISKKNRPFDNVKQNPMDRAVTSKGNSRMLLEHSFMPRPESEILADIEKLGREPGFIYTFCLMVGRFIWASKEDTPELDSELRPNLHELSLVFGLFAKHSFDLDQLPIERDVKNQMGRAVVLLRELHQYWDFPASNRPGVEHDGFSSTAPDSVQDHEAWMKSGQGLVEPIFYGDLGAYGFQYFDMAPKRYGLDRTWIERNVGISLETIVEIAKAHEQVALRRMRVIDHTGHLDIMLKGILTAMSFHHDDFPEFSHHDISCFLKKFSFLPGTVNQQFKSMVSYNVVRSRPAMSLGDGFYCIPLFPLLAQSIYESPSYWMRDQQDYKATADKNRGDTAEMITQDLLVPVFGATRTHRGVKVKDGKSDRTEIDILAYTGHKAVIVQCKSKLLTLNARSGDEQTLREDFQKAVQDAYSQGLEGRSAILSGGLTFEDSNGEPLELPDDIDEVYILCVTGDHYPAVLAQARLFLGKKEHDPHPIIMSIFDLDVVAFYLNDRFDFLYYLRQRTKYHEQFLTETEMNLLGYHLSHKLFPDPQANLTVLLRDYTELIDNNFMATRGGMTDTGSPNKLSNAWKGDPLKKLECDIKRSAEQRTDSRIPVEDLLFFLYDSAGTGTD